MLVAVGGVPKALSPLRSNTLNKEGEKMGIKDRKLEKEKMEAMDVGRRKAKKAK